MKIEFTKEWMERQIAIMDELGIDDNCCAGVTPMVKQVIIMRRDLKMRRGKEIAQAGHSVIAWLTKRITQSNFTYDYTLTTEEKIWLEHSFTKICLQVDSEEQLLEVYQNALDAGLTVHLITDNGATEFHGVKTNTCIAIGPHYADKIDPITKHLKLY